MDTQLRTSQRAFLVLALKKRQRIWRWPAVVNLTLGGTGAGLYLLATMLAFFSQSWAHGNPFVSFPLLAAAIVGIGFLTLTLEAGRPLRGYRLFSRLSESWLSIESLTGIVFIITAAGSHWSADFILLALAVASAMLFMVSQGMMLYRAVGVKAWQHGLVPFLFVTSGLMAACGVLLLNVRKISTLNRFTILILLVLIMLNLILWLVFLYGRSENNSNLGFKFLRRPALFILIAGLGHLLPIFHLGAVFFYGAIENRIMMAHLLSIGSGMLLLGGSACQKIGIVMATGFFRPILIDANITDNTLMQAH